LLNQLWHDLWIAVFIILILIGIFSGYGLVIGFGVMGLMVAGIAWLWNKLSLEDVSYERRLSQQRVFIGEEVALTVTLTNKKPVPLGRVEVEDELPKAVHVADADVFPSPNPHSQTMRHATSMAWYERIRWDYRMKCAQRGLYYLGPARLNSGDLFGFFTSEKTAYGQDYLLVYPRVVPLPELGIPGARPLGEVKGGIRIFEDTSRPLSIRDYQSGDPLKIVDWKASARAQQLKVHTYEPSSTMTVILVVVVETTAHYWEGYSPRNLERVITAAASLASYAAERQYNLGLFSNGTPVLSDRPMKIPPSRSPEQLTVVLEALATIRPMAMGPMAAHLAEHARRFPIGATLVLVTAIMPPELVDATRSLRAQGHKIVVMHVGDEPLPQLPEGVIVHQLRDYFIRMEQASEFGPR
jgi:uncharacterized repeat protein (TIGR01451 family)